jgi:hypothetical protein
MDWDGSKFEITTSGGGFAWTNVTATPQALSSDNGYIISTVAGPTVLTLPATPAIGDTFKIINSSADGWQIDQAASQQIFVGDISTISGVGHGISALEIGTSITLVCINAGATKQWASDGGPQGIIGFF